VPRAWVIGEGVGPTFPGYGTALTLYVEAGFAEPRGIEADGLRQVNLEAPPPPC
jgi:hypothetical protein